MIKKAKEKMSGTINNDLQNYTDLLRLLENNETDKRDVYNKLLEKEEKVLDIMSRVSTQEQQKNMFQNMFLNLSLYDIMARFAFTWQNIFTETVIDHRFDELPFILFQNDRKLYVGIMIVFISIFLYFVTL